MNIPIPNQPSDLLDQHLLDRHGASIRLYARQWCRHPDDALQEALVDLHHLSVLPDDPIAWLYITVKRRAINQTRAESRRRNHQTLAATEREAWFQVNPESEIETTEAISQLQEALSELPEMEREIVTARIWGELTFVQIASLVGKPSSTIHRLYHHALQTMQQRLQ